MSVLFSPLFFRGLEDFRWRSHLQDIRIITFFLQAIYHVFEFSECCYLSIACYTVLLLQLCYAGRSQVRSALASRGSQDLKGLAVWEPVSFPCLYVDGFGPFARNQSGRFHPELCLSGVFFAPLFFLGGYTGETSIVQHRNIASATIHINTSERDRRFSVDSILNALVW